LTTLISRENCRFFFWGWKTRQIDFLDKKLTNKDFGFPIPIAFYFQHSIDDDFSNIHSRLQMIKYYFVMQFEEALLLYLLF